MTIKEFKSLTGSELLRFKTSTTHVDSDKPYRIHRITRYMSTEPKYTVKQFLSMDKKKLDKLSKWEPEVVDGVIELDLEESEAEELAEKMGLAHSYRLWHPIKINYKNLMVVKQKGD